MPLLGDLIAKATHALGIKQCEPCKQRQASFNRFDAKLRYGIKCPECMNYAWMSEMRPAVDLTGAKHHPACPRIAKTFVLEVRRGK